MKERRENKELGEIEYTELGFEHGVLTFMITLDYGGTSQGFGGYVLEDTTWHLQDNYIPGVTGAGAIARILKAVGVNKWEDLKGKQVWAYKDKYDAICAIEAPKFIPHGKRFNIKKYFAGLDDPNESI